MRLKNKKEGRHQRAGVCLLLTGVMVVGMMALIFAFSAQDASRSSDLSGGLCGRIVRGVLTLLGAGADREKTELWVGILETPVRKLAHFTEYALFSVIVCTHGLMHRLVSGKRPALFQTGREAFRGFLPLFARTVPFCILYAVSDEVHQYFVPGRSCRLFDVGVDSTGILFGAALFLLTVHTQKVKIWIKWLQGPDKIKAQYDTSCREAAERYPVPDRSERIITMRCIELLEGLTYECLQGDVQVPVSAVINDSRKIAEGCMFLCIRGAAFDGHSFAGEAAKAGAAVLVVEEPVDVPEHVTVIKVDNTRYAMALISAAWFGHPDQEITTIAVTGTKGKTTTSTLIYSMLRTAGKSACLIGNMGYPVFDSIEDCKDEIAVIEMSSHQLEFTTRSPHIAVLTNIYPEHLDHYDSFECYATAKLNIERYQSAGDIFIYNSDQGLKGLFDPDSYAGEAVGVSVNDPDAGNFEGLNNRLIGRHNLHDCLFAARAADRLGVSHADIIKALENYEGIEHRLEPVGVVGSIKFYNDCIATIPHAVMCAVEALGDVDSLIFGGMDRGLDYSAFEAALEKSSIRNLICMPDTGHKIGMHMAELGSDKNIVVVEDMEGAVRAALSVTQKGKSCLLSPAAPSYNRYKDFEEKGRHFKSILRRIAELGGKTN